MDFSELVNCALPYGLVGARVGELEVRGIQRGGRGEGVVDFTGREEVEVTVDSEEVGGGIGAHGACIGRYIIRNPLNLRMG